MDQPVGQDVAQGVLAPARPGRPWIFTIVMALLGLAMGFGGVSLIAVGGSPFYLLAALAMLGTAVLLWKRSRWAPWLYAALIVVLIVWTLWEVGLDPWAMLPRLGLFYALGAWMLLPWARRHLTGGPRLSHGAGRAAAALIALAAIATPLSALAFGSYWEGSGDYTGGRYSDGPAAAADWQAFGGTAAGSRFSGLGEITPANVGKLELAWTYSFNENPPGALQMTPLKIGDSLYGCNGTNNVVALDPVTGRQKWRFSPKVAKDTPFLSCRGVAYYKVPDATGTCAERVYTTTVDARLFALDAATGRLCQGFGDKGTVGLLDGFGKVLAGYYSYTAAPTIARGKIILGGTNPDNQYWGEPSGVIRAFDAVTGKLVWAYDAGHPDRVGLPPAGETYTPGTPNNWGQMSFDDALGLVYVPTGNSTPDYFGAQRRPFDDDTNSAVMALDVETGRRRWIFQTTHHDVWDYDLGSQPVLFDVPSPAGPIHALAQPSKRGEIFLINRETGKPLSPMEERAVSQRGHAPGERLSPTQPYPTDMPSLVGPKLTEQRMWGVTPFDQMWCRIRFKEARYDGTFTPPGLTPSITNPGFLGGMDWGSISIDPQRGVLIAPTEYLANHLQLYPRSVAIAEGAFPMGKGRVGGEAFRGINSMEGTPYGSKTWPFISPLNVPCQQPPWSRLNAIDLKTRKVIWSRPLGTSRETGPFGIRTGIPLTMGVPSLGGVLMTKSGLSFIGASVDRTFRAFDTATGKLLWQTEIPRSAHANPMTYMGRDGRQYVVVAAAGHRTLGSTPGDKLVAFALPR